jgi:hypothetical protein
MATLSFEGETHAELVTKVRRWLASVDGSDAGTLSPQDALEQGAEITKDALRVIASAAPEPIAQSDVVKALTGMGYKATDATKEALTAGLDSFDELTGGGAIERARKTSRSAMYQMNAAVARQILRAMKG